MPPATPFIRILFQKVRTTPTTNLRKFILHQFYKQYASKYEYEIACTCGQTKFT